jgi:hypothetical protein
MIRKLAYLAFLILTAAEARAQSVRIDPTILTRPAETAERWNDGSSVRVAATRDADGITSVFMEDVVLLEQPSPETLDDLRKRFGARVERTNELPAHITDTARGRRLPPTPIRYTLHIDAAQLQAFSLADELRAAGDAQDVVVSSASAARLMAFVMAERRRGTSIHLRFMGERNVVPLAATQELNGANGFVFPGYGGSGPQTFLTRAWQFLQAANITTRVRLAVVDSGFMVQSNGACIPDASGSCDLNPVFTFETRGHGSDVSGDPTALWHGTAVASVAAAPLNNNAGAAGAGGLVADLMLLKDDQTFDLLEEGIRVAYLQYADVINISSAGPCNWWCKTLGDISDLVHIIEHVANEGVLVVAAAGNDGFEVLSNNIVPCTRTRALCVGATNITNDRRAAYSNYGDSVWIWAPGGDSTPAGPCGPMLAQVWTMPDAACGPNTLVANTGTSFAAPFVAGVAAMIKAIKPSLTGDALRDIIMNTAWTNSSDPLVKRRINAYAAVLAAAGGRLPPDRFDAAAPNGAPTAATTLPLTSTANAFPDLNIAEKSDVDWYRMDFPGYTQLIVEAQYVASLGWVALTELTPLDDFMGPELVSTIIQPLPNGRTQVIHTYGLVAPGPHGFSFSGNDPTAYDLNITYFGSGIGPDSHEPNNSAAEARQIARCDGLIEANLHSAGDADWYRLTARNAQYVLTSLRFVTADALPVATIYDAAGGMVAKLGRGHAKRLTPGDYTIMVSGDRPSRYVLACDEVSLDPMFRGGLLERVDINHWKPIGPNPAPWRRYLADPVEYFLFVAEPGMARILGLGANLRLDILKANGELLVAGTRQDDRERGEVAAVATERLEPGQRYVLRVAETERSSPHARPFRLAVEQR